MMSPMDSMNMMGGSPITGKWTNKNTGETINVRDSVIMDDEMQIILDNGTMMDMDTFSKYYIQMGDEEFEAPNVGKGFDIPKEDMNNNVFLDKPLNTSKSKKTSNKETSVYLDKPFENSCQPEIPSLNTENTYSNSFDLVDKLFNKVSSSPDIQLNFKWDEFPKNELNMLMNFFDVSIEDISRYVFTHYFNDAAIIDTISRKLESMLK